MFRNIRKKASIALHRGSNAGLVHVSPDLRQEEPETPPSDPDPPSPTSSFRRVRRYDEAEPKPYPKLKTTLRSSPRPPAELAPGAQDDVSAERAPPSPSSLESLSQLSSEPSSRAPSPPPQPPLFTLDEEMAEDGDEGDSEQNRDLDSYAPKYVPYADSAPLRNGILSSEGSHYGRVNASIMGGFGSDDDSIWLVDDEETDEEHSPPKSRPESSSSTSKSQSQSQSHSQPASSGPADVEVSHTKDRPSLEDLKKWKTAFEASRSSAAPKLKTESSLEQLENWQQTRKPATNTIPKSITGSSSAMSVFRYASTSIMGDDDEFETKVPPPPLEPEAGPAPKEDPITTTPPKKQAYGAVPMSILSGWDDEDEPATEPKEEAWDPSRKPGGSSRSMHGGVLSEQEEARSSLSGNPYVDMFEEQDMAMTVAYLRRLEQLDSRGDGPADDFSFGQRYQKASDSVDVIVTHQRQPSDHLSGEADCVICAETKPVEEFPRFSITATCAHAPATCLTCVAASIRSDLDSKLWTEIRCPECRAPLDYADIQRYSDRQTFLRYETLALRAAMSEADNFIWCTSGCGSGQIHDSGADQPIVTCLHCGHLSCFTHNIAWHKTLTCEEYDKLLADPENFRSQMELDNEEWTRERQAQLDADRAVAQGLLAEEQEETNRRIDKEREEREMARRAMALARKIAARRKWEEDQSRATVSQTTKPCPGCGWAIEKDEGCSHMTCSKCRHEFCYECGADHKNIMANDNRQHKETCRFHPDSMESDDSGDIY